MSRVHRVVPEPRSSSMSYADVLPPLRPEERDALRADIARHGVQVPIVVDEDGVVIDGHHRLEIARELGIECPRVTQRFTDDLDRREAALRLNLLRRHLGPVTWGQAFQRLCELRGARLGKAGRPTANSATVAELATGLGVPYRTARRRVQLAEALAGHPDLAEVVDRGELPAARALREARRREGRPAARPSMRVHYMSEDDEWLTPPEILEAVVAALGAIDLDPCAEDVEPPNVPARRHLRRSEDGLSQPWSGRVYMNPPYGRSADDGRTVADWVRKLIAEHETGRVIEAVALLPARTDTSWFHDLRDYPRCFLRGRLRFSGSEQGAPFPSMAVYLGPTLERFARAFAPLGDTFLRFEP